MANRTTAIIHGISLTLVAFVIASAAQAQAQDQAAEETAKIAGPVTLKLESAHPRDVLAKLTEVTGVQTKVWPENTWDTHRGANGPPTSITVDIDNKPFWSAMQEICDACNLSPQNMGNDDAISLQYMGNKHGMLGKRPVSVGPLATVVINSSQRNHTIYYENENAEPQKRCGVDLQFYIDPRLHLANYQSQPTVEKAEDESGNSIASQPANHHDSMSDPNSTWQLSAFVPLDYDPEKSKKLATLKGSIRGTVVTEIEKFEVEDLEKAQGTDKTVAGRQIVIDEVKNEDKNITLKITIIRKELDKKQWQDQSRTIFRSMKFVNAEGKKSNVGGGGGGGDDKVTYIFNTSYSNDADKPVKFVWEIPTKLEEIDIPFEFKDLTLP